MITFNNFNGFDTYWLNDFNGLPSTELNVMKLREKIEDLYFRDNTVDYSTKGINWSIFDIENGSMLEIRFD